MGKLYVSEFTGLAATTQSDSVPLLPGTSSGDQVVSYTTATPSVAFKSTTQWVEIETDSICSIVFSPSATPIAATTSNMRMQAGDRLIRKVSPGDQVSAITNT